MDIISYILSRKYTDNAIVGLGSIRGANCTIKDIVHQDGVNTVTFEWEGTDGTKKTRDMVVYDGTPIYVWESGNTYHYGDLAIYESQFYRCIIENSDVTFDNTKWNEIGSPDGNYDIVQSKDLLPARFTAADRKLYFVIDECIFYLWDGYQWVALNHAVQLDSFPVASEKYFGKIYQYIGTTTNNYTHGYFYQCVSNGETPAVYTWEYVQTSDIQIATVQKAGIVKPDGETIDIDGNGVISVINRIFTGTQEEWDELAPEVQVLYKILHITDDEEIIDLGVYLRKVKIMPNAEDYPSEVVMYIGDTNANYTRGYNYRSTPTVTNGVTTYHWKVLNILRYEIMPSIENLFNMPNNSIFFTNGYYSVEDGNGGYYKITVTWTKNSKRITYDNKTRYLIALDDEGWQREHINLCRFGVRRFDGIADGDVFDINTTYAKLNSDIIDNIIDAASMIAGNTWELPMGKFYFERPLNIGMHQKRLIGANIPDFRDQIASDDYAYSGGTILVFPFLSNGESAIIAANSTITDIAIVGSVYSNELEPNYNFTIDRSKTITAPDEVVTEIIKDVDGVEYKTTGIRATSALIMQNVVIIGFYTGMNALNATNIYASNIFAKKCHSGFIFSNDTKITGIFGWNVHTLLELRYAISSVNQLRVDSCVNAIRLVDAKTNTISDVDGDYCTDSLIVADGVCANNTIIGIHGRCCTLKSYDKTQNPDGIDIRDIDNTAGYGIIRATNNFKNNYVVLNAGINGNPFDTTSDYLTPKIIFTFDKTLNINNLSDNTFVLADTIDGEGILKEIQTSNGLSLRVDTSSATYFIDGTTVNDGTIILGKWVDGAGINQNMLGFTSDFTEEKTAHSLVYDFDTDIFTLTALASGSSSIPLSSHMVNIPNIKAGEKFRFYIRRLTGSVYNYFANWYYAPNKVLAMSDAKVMFGNTLTKVFTAESDMEGLSMWTNYSSSEAIDFQIWITKGEDFVPYVKYGAPAKGYVLNSDVIDNNDPSTDIDFTTVLGGE